jgi:GT2 family glycosyltransferase
MTLASVIIPVWNGGADLPACLDALLAQTHAPVEIIAVDNASTDHSADLIAASYPQVKLICNAANLGFGGACNVGLAAAQGDPLVLLNQDTVVRPDWLAELVRVLQTHPDVGIAGSKALYPDGTIQHAGGQIDAQGNGSHRGYRQPDTGGFDALADVDFVTGASLALRRAVYMQIGGLDEDFAPVYFEDVDLCLRGRAAGWRVVYAPTSVLVHAEHSAGVALDYDSMVRFHTNRLRLVLKHWPAARLQDEFLPAERAWLENMAEGGEQLVAAVHQAYLTHLLRLDKIARHRQAFLGEPPDAITGVAQVLLALRTVYPLGVVGGAALALAASQDATLTQLDQLVQLRPQFFQSRVPVIGPLIAAFRTQWNRVATEWYLQPILRQQTHFNMAATEAARQAFDTRRQDAYQRERQAAVLTAYLAGQAREISALTQEIAALKAKLARQE